MTVAVLAGSMLTLIIVTSLAALLSGLLPARMSNRDKLDLNYFMMAASLAVTSAAPFVFSRRHFFAPIARVWAATDSHAANLASGAPAREAVTIATTSFIIARPNLIAAIVIGVGCALLIAAVINVCRQACGLRRLIKSALIYKKYATVHVYLSGEIEVPFSFWLPRKNVVVLPADFAGSMPTLRMALFHELQHHRQRDTRWLYVMLVIKKIGVFNPIINFWMRQIGELQEYACDEALVGRKRISPKAYARCLLTVAETATRREPAPACAAGLSFSADGHFLKRRIEMIFNQQKDRPHTTLRPALMLIFTVLFACAAWASQGLVQDRHVTRAQALEMLKLAPHGDGFDVVINDLVLSELNRFIGTPDGRDFMKRAIERMKTYKPAIEAKLQGSGVPVELEAIPVIESGYQNLPQSSHQTWGAGLWMFIKSTARNFGLQVDDAVDQRLDVTLETDAAVRYLIANKARFNDWTLSVLAYNAGESAVQQAIDKLGTRDPWVIVRHRLGSEPDYLPRLMAAILIVENPDVLN